MKPDVCPACGSKRYKYQEQGKYYKCLKCGFVWDESFNVKPAVSKKSKVIAGEPEEEPSVYNPEEPMDTEIEEDGLIEDELF